MDKFMDEDGLFAGQPDEKLHTIADALDNLPNPRYRRLLIGLYRDKWSPKVLAEEMGVSMPNFYNLHRRALASLKASLSSKT